MKILATGARGFVGKNLVVDLREKIKAAADGAVLAPNSVVFEHDVDSDPGAFDAFCRDADFVVHLAGVNRPKSPDDYLPGNLGCAATLLETLKKFGRRPPILFASSTQATRDVPYGRSKKASEELFFQYAEATGAPVFVYRFPNLFGKWQRPNYNGVVATFCRDVADDRPIRVDDASAVLTLAYVDDVVDEIVAAIEGNATRDPNDPRFCAVPIVHTATVGRIAELVRSFRAARDDLGVPDLGDPFVRKLYATYQSFLPPTRRAYPLRSHRDERGSFTEILRTENRGQFSVNVAKPGVVKGEHWHRTKHEKFLVVSGRAVVRLRRVDDDEIFEYFVSGDRFEVVDIPPGCAHHIECLGETEATTFMWCDEPFDPNRPDTYFLPVGRKNDAERR